MNVYHVAAVRAQGVEVTEREVYEGHFRLDRYWGQGELRHRDGRIYRGEFVRGDLQGKGRLENPDGSRYEGEFKDWRFHGKGRLRHSGDRKGRGIKVPMPES